MNNRPLTQYEEAQEEITERFQSVLDNSLDAVYRRNLHTDTYDYLSPAIEHITGYAPDEFQRFNIPNILQRIHPDDLPGVNATLARMRTTSDRSAVLTYRLKTKSGAYRWVSDSLSILVDGDGSPRYCVGAVRDVTRQHEAESALRTHKAKLEAVIRSMNDAVLIVDAESGRVEFNDAFAVCCRLTDAQKCRKTIAKYWNDFDAFREDGTAVPREFWTSAYLMSRGEIPDAKYMIRNKKTGETWWVNFSFAPIRDSDGATIGVVVTGHDVTEEKLAQERLEELKEYYRTLSEHSPDIVFRIDRELRCTYMSPSVTRFKGKPAEYYLGKAFLETVTQAGEAVVTAVRAVFASKRQQVTDITYDTTAGQEHFHVIFVPEFDSGGNATTVLCIARDITRLKKSEEQITHIVNSIDDGFFALDTEWRFTYINKRAARNVGFEPEQLVGRNLWQQLPRIRGSKHETNYRKVMEQRQAAAFEMHGILSDRWYSIAVYPSHDGGISVFWSDITDRKRTDGRLAADLAALTRMHDLSGRLLGAGGTRPLLQEIVDTAVAIMGADRGSLQLVEGDDLKIVTHRGHDHTFIEFFSKKENRLPEYFEVLQREKRVIVPDVEESALFAGTRQLKVLRSCGIRALQAIPLVSRTGELLGILATQWIAPHAPDRHELWLLDLLVRQAADLIEHVRAAEVLRRDKTMLEKMVSERTQELFRMHGELERARRMADIGRLSATVAHEIRNPLAAISIAAYNIRRKARNPLLGKHLETITRKVLESDNIIQNLLSFSRIKKMHVEKLHIHDLVKDCVATMTAKYAGWNVTLDQHVDCAKGGSIEADHTQFKMLLCNILDNAYQALPGKTGTITLRVRKDEHRFWRITVSDTGAGIDGQEMEKIFEPFYTTRPRGTGLGLAVCREIAEMHRGKIEVTSGGKGTGATFIVTLPARQAELQSSIVPLPRFAADTEAVPELFPQL